MGKIIGYFFLSCFLCHSIQSQETSSPPENKSQSTENKVADLDEVIIIASRYERQLESVTRNVNIISEAQIKEMPYVNITGLLANESGIFIVGQSQTPGSNLSIFMRGANSNQTIILLDGIRLNDPSTPNGALDLSEISLIDVKRIEILRGTQGSMYGSSAIGGVINIVTRTPNKGIAGNVSVQAATIGESAGFLRTGTNISYRHQSGFYIGASLERLSVNGLDATFDTITSEAFRTQDKDDFYKLDWQAKTGYHQGPITIDLTYKSVEQLAEIDVGAFHDDDNSTIEFSRQLLNYRVTYELISSSLQWLGTATGLERIFENDSSVIDFMGNTDQTYFRSQNNGRNHSNELQYIRSYENGGFIVGLGRQREEMDFKSYFFSNAFGPFEWVQDFDTIDMNITNYYAFGQWVINGNNDMISDKWSLTLGGRLIYHSTYDSQFSYDITPAYSTDVIKVYSVLSSGFQNPSLIQLFDPSIQFGHTLTRGNAGLTPERSAGLELGFQAELNKNWKVSASLFSTRVNNMIEYVYLWDKTKPVTNLSFSDYRGDRYINVLSLQTQGVEASLTYNSKKVNGILSWQYLHGQFKFDPDNADGELHSNFHVQSFSNGSFLVGEKVTSGLTRRPSMQLMSSLSFKPLRAMSLNGHYRMVSHRNDSFYDPTLGPFGALNVVEMKAFHIVTLSASYTYKNLIAGFQIENLFNAQYQEIQGFRSRGMGVGIKIQYSF